MKEERRREPSRSASASPPPPSATTCPAWPARTWCGWSAMAPPCATARTSPPCGVSPITSGRTAARAAAENRSRPRPAARAGSADPDPIAQRPWPRGEPMQIRRRLEQDLPSVIDLLEGADLPPDGLERTEGWVAEEGGRILGHV